jgi:hypothetical protein
MTDMSTKLTPHEERAVAVKAGTDPRTVRKFIAGGSMRSTTSARVAEALRDLHLRAAPLSEPPPHA